MAQGQPTLVLQGIETPGVNVDRDSFMEFTRRMRFMMKSRTAINGFGTSDSIALRQTGIINKIWIRVTGTVAATAGAATTSEWPYNLIKGVKLAANGQANLVALSGLQLKLVNVIGNPALNSNGVQRAANQAVGAYGAQNGTASLSSEDWGTVSAANSMGPAVTALTAATYTVDLWFEIPVSFDDRELVGAIYAQTNATQLTIDIDWETHANLAAAGTLTPTLSYQILGEVFSIPQVNGRYVVPDMSSFHSLIGTRQSGLAQGDNEILMTGTGVGRQWMRVIWQVYTGTAPGAPLAVNDTNFGLVGWRFGGSDTPEQVQHAAMLRAINEMDYVEDIGRVWGAACFDFATAWAFRDSVDQGSTTDLRLVVNLPSSPTNGIARIISETIFAAPVGA